MIEVALSNSSMDGEFMKKLNTKIFNLFMNAWEVLSVSSIIRYRLGEGKGIHRDNDGEKDVNNVYGLVFYLNDDYEGGEICYPSLNYSIKPKKNSVLIHYAGLEHGVNNVISGTRYVLTSFVKGDSGTTVKEK